MDETDALTTAVTAWMSAVLPHLDPGQLQIIHAMLAGLCDVAVEVRLRRGTVCLVAIDDVQGMKSELYREDVLPLRADSGFATPTTSRNQ